MKRILPFFLLLLSLFVRFSVAEEIQYVERFALADDRSSLKLARHGVTIRSWCQIAWSRPPRVRFRLFRR
jgi:hypothetical protein